MNVNVFSEYILWKSSLCQALEKNYREESALMFVINKVTVSYEPQKLKQETRPHNENCYNSSYNSSVKSVMVIPWRKRVVRHSVEQIGYTELEKSRK